MVRQAEVLEDVVRALAGEEKEFVEAVGAVRAAERLAALTDAFDLAYKLAAPEDVVEVVVVVEGTETVGADLSVVG